MYSVLFCSGVVDNDTLQYNSSRVVDLGCSLASETDGVDALGGEGGRGGELKSNCIQGSIEAHSTLKWGGG